MRKLLSLLLSAAIASAILIPLKGTNVNAATSSFSGVCHVQDYGDTQGRWDASSGTLTLGTRGQSKRVEQVTINFNNNTGYEGGIEYRVHVQNIGWMQWVKGGQAAGTRGQALRLEGIEIRLTGEIANHYSISYAVHIQDYGDAQGFVRDGALAGTTGESKRLEEVRVKLVPLDTSSSIGVSYRVQRQDYGWEAAWAANGQSSGTTGQSKRLEAIEIHLTGAKYSGGITYRTHVQNIGWESSWANNGELAGTVGQSLRLEAIQIKLTGEIANHYDVYYRVHTQNLGWLDWAKNGDMAGTAGKSYRLEAIQIKLVAKNAPAPGPTALSFVDQAATQRCLNAYNQALADYNNAGLKWLDETSVACGGQTVEYYIDAASRAGLTSGDLSIYTKFTTPDAIRRSISFIEECNSLRAAEGRSALVIDPRLMAATVASTTVSCYTLNHTFINYAWSHMDVPSNGENLAWGYSDPFTGWYYNEKSSNGGHYRNIIATGFSATGFATATGLSGVRYRTAFGQDFGTATSSCMTPDQYRNAFEAYIAEKQTAVDTALANYNKVR